MPLRDVKDLTYHLTQRLFGQGVKQHPGTAPGTLSYVGPDKAFTPRATQLAYSSDSFSETELTPGVSPKIEPRGTNLFLFRGVHDPDLVNQAAQWFGLHPLTVEDILNTTIRPKAEDLDDERSLFVLKHVSMHGEGSDSKAAVGTLSFEQVSLVRVGETLLLFQESEEELFEPVLARIRKGRSRIRSCGADYLLIALLDCLVDLSYETLSKMSQQAEDLDDLLLARTDDANLLAAYRLKREVLFLLDALVPAQDILAHLAKENAEAEAEDTRHYLRDVTDHAIQVIAAARTLHEVVGSMIAAHIALAGLRMNRAMSMLSVVATIFIPLTFLAGIYGMNFHNMPELGWPWAYPTLLGLMLAIGLGLWRYFSKKKWF